jgi:quercetin dioxygenase-like cupin family protein
MKIKRREDTPAVEVPGYTGVTKQVVLGPADGSDEIVLRHFTLEAGAATPRHTHDFPHLVKIEAGRGVAVDAVGTENPVSVGEYVYVAPDELHNFRNTGEEPFEFTCIVPRRGE